MILGSVPPSLGKAEEQCITRMLLSRPYPETIRDRAAKNSTEKKDSSADPGLPVATKSESTQDLNFQEI